MIWSTAPFVPSHGRLQDFVRLRLLDGANARNFKLAFSDERPFHVVANDAGWLAEPFHSRTSRSLPVNGTRSLSIFRMAGRSIS